MKKITLLHQCEYVITLNGGYTFEGRFHDPDYEMKMRSTSPAYFFRTRKGNWHLMKMPENVLELKEGLYVLPPKKTGEFDEFQTVEGLIRVWNIQKKLSQRFKTEVAKYRLLTGGVDFLINPIRGGK